MVLSRFMLVVILTLYEKRLQAISLDGGYFTGPSIHGSKNNLASFSNILVSLEKYTYLE